jgi:FlaA1/EpsC-like NDP-sugar epimerase
MAQGGDVFVLDMGEPVKITELARKMIQLMGRELYSSENPDGIEIEFSGLRPGEKLYEELLIGDDVVGTDHPKIMRAHEELLAPDELKQVLSELAASMDSGDNKAARSLLEQAVRGFKPNSPLVDWLAVSDLDSAVKPLH